MKMTHQDIIEATGGICQGSFAFSSVSIDSRTVEEGALFIAIDGESKDGHCYVSDALAKGAVAAVVHKSMENVDLAQCVQVSNTYEALWDFAYYCRKKIQATYIGITGSVGKTSTKEMLFKVLSCYGKTYATKGNYNNHYGVPLTLCNMPRDASYVVVEMGMNHANEIAPLSRLVQPDIAIITAVEAAHIEFFDDVSDIARAKSEIFEGLSMQGSAVINRDSPQFSIMQDAARHNHVCTFGVHHDANIRLDHVMVRSVDCQDVHANVEGEAIHYKLGLAGKHQAINSLCVLACLHLLRLNIDVALPSFEQIHAPNGRGHIEMIPWGSGTITVIDESYNASPASVEAAIKTLAKYPMEGRLIVILGDMFELGDKAKILHQSLVPVLEDEQVDKVFAVGTLMRGLFEMLPQDMQGSWAENVDALLTSLFSSFEPGDIIMIKGSRGMHMEQILTKLKEKHHAI